MTEAPIASIESVWDYPRPPRLEAVHVRVRVVFGQRTIADSRHAYRVLETSHPPVYYLPPADIEAHCIEPAPGRSFCEFKGHAAYWNVRVHPHRALRAAWSYPDPTPAFRPLAGYLAFYPSRMDACFVNDEPVVAQHGDFYGGWITANIRGPFKGGPGTLGW